MIRYMTKHIFMIGDCAKYTKIDLKIVRIGQSAFLKIFLKILLTFVEDRVYIIRGC